MAANGFVDGCGFTAASSGTGDFVVSSAVVGYQTPLAANAVNGTIYSYRAESASRADWEIGFGAYTTGTTTLARTTVLYNSAGTTSKISFSAAPNVYITALTADIQNASLLASGTVSTSRLPLGTSANQVPQLDSGGHLLNAVMGTSSLGSNGYYTLPGGLIIQWGYQSTVGANTTFPLTFPTSVWSVVTTKQQSPVLGTQTQSMIVATISTSGFTVDTSPGNTSKTAYYWMAVGV